MTDVQRLPYLPTADVVVLADGSRWVRERTCHVVRDLGVNDHDEHEYEMACRSSREWPADNFVPRYCPWCGGRIVDEKGSER